MRLPAHRPDVVRSPRLRGAVEDRRRDRHGFEADDRGDIGGRIAGSGTVVLYAEPDVMSHLMNSGHELRVGRTVFGDDAADPGAMIHRVHRQTGDLGFEVDQLPIGDTVVAEVPFGPAVGKHQSGKREAQVDPVRNRIVPAAGCPGLDALQILRSLTNGYAALRAWGHRGLTTCSGEREREHGCCSDETHVTLLQGRNRDVARKHLPR